MKMKYLNKSVKSLLACLVILALGSSTAFAMSVWNGGSDPAPMVVLSASPSTIVEGQSTTLSWTSSFATSCSAGGTESWTDSTATSGSVSVSPTITMSYMIVCEGDGGSIINSVVVTVNAAPEPVPTVSLSTSSSTIDEGQSATLSWSSTDASSCSASWTGSSATSGSASVSPTVTTTYSVSCDGGGGSASDSVEVIVRHDLVGDYVGGTNATQVYDTSFAVEFSYSCLGGGCHETDQTLVDEYAASKMTHAMVKCNACHGTHTADTVGLEKPNLTGYYPGIGATGYSVDTDRCKSCHNNEHTGGNKGSDNCYSCHTPHIFGAGGGGGGPGGR
jgi:hypothetical protein